MALVTPTELATTLGVGTLYSDATLQEICDAADAVILPMLWTNVTYNTGHSNTTNTGTLYFNQPVQDIFYVGQSVVIGGNGSKHNGSKTITGVGPYSISYAITGNNNTAAPQHPVNPLGTVTAESYVDWTTDSAVQLAALMVAVDIYQSKQAPSSGGVSIDGYTPSPYRMGNALLGRVRGLLAHALSPNSQIG